MFETNTFGPACERDIVALESRLGLKLPESYRAFILRQNGGSPEPSLYRDERRRRSLNVGLFFPVTDEIIEECVDYFMNSLDTGLLPIASSGGGDYFLLDVHTGGIYYWDYNEGADILDRDELPLVAESIDHLLDSLVDGV